MAIQDYTRTSDRTEAAMTPLLTRMRLFDELLRMAVSRAQAVGFIQGEYQGLFVDDSEVNRHLSNPPGSGLWDLPTQPFDIEGWRSGYEASRADLDRRERAQGTPLGLLAERFDLTALDVDLLLLAIAPEIDRRYERLYSYLQDDVTRRRASVEFALSLLAETPAARAEVWGRLLPGSTLIDSNLLLTTTDQSQRDPAFSSHFLKVEPHIITYLIGLTGVDPRISSAVELLPQLDQMPESYILNADLGQRMFAAYTERPIFYCYGPDSGSIVSAARAVAGAAGQPLVTVDLPKLKIMAGEVGFEAMARLAFREARLIDAPLALEGWVKVLDDSHTAPPWLMRAALAHPQTVFLIGSEVWEPHAIERDRLILRLELAAPEYEERVAAWETNLGGTHEGIINVANKFRLTASQIRDAAQTARDLAAWRGDSQPTDADLFSGARSQSNRKLSNLAQKIDPRFTWADIILPDDNFTQLHEVVNQVQHAQRVYGDWGFRGRSKNTRGITALFAGDSGTGKTMSADVIAHELGLDLYRIDLSSVVSKYIGETEKNLGAIFDEATQSNAILFFDEADSLFGKRSEVKDSHDRYANIETGYLLQRMESYNGVAILATNRLQDLDKAFIRRLDIVITFPTAEKSDRARIWKVTFPKNAPLAADVDFDDLARRHKQLAGGNIRNVVTMSAFIAATEGQSQIALRHIEHAIKREYQKLSKLVE